MELIDFIENLNLGRILRVEKCEKGLHNATYRVYTNKGIFSLRVYKYKKPGQIRFELAMLERLKGKKAPQLIMLGDDFIRRFNDKYVIVYKYIEGDHLSEFNEKQLVEVGEFIGEFHNLCKDFRWEKYRYQFYNLPDWKIEKFTKISKAAKIKHLGLLPDIIKELKENRLSRKLPRGPIHVDIKPENVLFYNGKLSGVIDFDNSFIGPFILDLAKSMVWFGTKNKKIDMKKAIHIYKGYVQKRKLDELERKELYKAVKFAFLSHVFVDYYMRAINATTDEYFEFIVNDLYASYKSFKMTQKEFDKLI